MVAVKDLAQLVGTDGLDAIIELYTLDLSSIDPAQAPFRFCNWAQSGGQPLRYAGQTYEPVPVECSGFEINSRSAPSEPRMQVSNVGLTWTGFMNRWDDLVGAKLIRRRVLRRYLDDGATPSPTGHWPDEPWFIEQKVSENKLTVTFALSTAFALDDIRLPKRLALRYTCSWTYRGEGCGYTGYPVADAKDQPLPAPMDPRVQAYLNSVEAMWAAQGNVMASIAWVQAAEATYNATRSVWTKQEERYVTQGPAISYAFLYAPGTQGGALGYGFWGGVVVQLNETFRAASSGGISYNDGAKIRPIERWAFDQAAADRATADLTASRANLDAALAHRENLRAQALAQKPAADAVRDPRDQCSKTLQGCRLRFFDPIAGQVQPLPTSAFPGLQIG